MHIPDGVLDPGTLVVAGAMSTGALVWSARELRRGHQRWGVALGGAGAVLVFHLADVPLYGPYTAHVIGGTLLAIALGPWLAMLTMAAVLALEALAWGDGGIAALGVNVLVMGVVGVLAGYSAYRGVLALAARRRPPDAAAGWRSIVAAAVGAWVSVIASALTLVAVSAAGGASGIVMSEVLPHHAAWGALEAVATGTALAIGLAWGRHGARRRGRVRGPVAAATKDAPAMAP